MKRIFTIAAALFMTASVWAQSPEKMSYQAVVRNASDALVTSTAVGMQISILQGGTTGTAVYVETQTPSTNANGLVSLEIGTGTLVSGDFTTIDWANDTYFIKTETDPTGGTTYSITGTSQLMSVPYALHSKTAENITGAVNYTETDPIFGASVANGITAIDTANWNNHTVDTDTQLDSTAIVALGFVAGPHTVNTDTDNQTLTVSMTGDTLTINGGNSVLVPGISLLNHPPVAVVGDFRDGGVVFWVDPADNTKGLVCSVVDQSTGIQWYNGASTVTGAVGTAIGTGQSNTTTVVASQGVGVYAAQLCDDLVLNGFNDWFLPSLDELLAIKSNEAIINSTCLANGGTAITAFDYWSSGEFNNSMARVSRAGTGSGANPKSGLYYVRAVRAF